MTTDVQTELERTRRVPGIHFIDGTLGRVPCLDGTGLEVFEVVKVYLAAGRNKRLLRRAYNWLTTDQIDAALRYYRYFPAEVEARLRAEDDDES